MRTITSGLPVDDEVLEVRARHRDNEILVLRITKVDEYFEFTRYSCQYVVDLEGYEVQIKQRTLTLLVQTPLLLIAKALLLFEMEDW
jgi:hypothetical protein